MESRLSATGGHCQRFPLLLRKHRLVFRTMVLEESAHIFHSAEEAEIAQKNRHTYQTGNKVEPERILLNREESRGNEYRCCKKEGESCKERNRNGEAEFQGMLPSRFLYPLAVRPTLSIRHCHFG